MEAGPGDNPPDEGYQTCSKGRFDWSFPPLMRRRIVGIFFAPPFLGAQNSPGQMSAANC